MINGTAVLGQGRPGDLLDELILKRFSEGAVMQKAGREEKLLHRG